jgi:hypothetical protein
MGMTIGQVRELSKQGKISADQMLAAFHKFATDNGLSDMLEKCKHGRQLHQHY